MTGTLRSTFTGALAALGLALALVLGAAAPSEARPVDQQGLVNVNVGDVTVQVPIAIAANICGVAVNVIAEFDADGDIDCEAVAESDARSQRGQGQGPVNQEGLINLNVGDVTIQVPVAVAANICGLAVNVIADADIEGTTTCEALATSGAEG